MYKLEDMYVAWLLEHADSYSYSTDLACALISHFDIQDDTWVLDTAQDVLEFTHNRSTEEKYA